MTAYDGTATISPPFGWTTTERGKTFGVTHTTSEPESPSSPQSSPTDSGDHKE